MTLPKLPTWLTLAASALVPPGGAESPEVKARVLVIDDESAVCDLLSLYLSHKGFGVATVRTAHEAQALIERGQFDLVILDWKLDGADGLDLLHLSKTHHPDVPVIIFTGADLHDGVIEGGLAREADAVVRKMSSLDALSTAVFRCLDQRWAHPFKAA